MKKLEIMTIDNNDYIIMKEVKEENTIYVFLSNVNNPEDVMIRKSTDNENYIPLENEEEYKLATLLLFKQ